jgi:hypothetical protein
LPDISATIDRIEKLLKINDMVAIDSLLRALPRGLPMCANLIRIYAAFAAKNDAYRMVLVLQHVASIDQFYLADLAVIIRGIQPHDAIAVRAAPSSSSSAPAKAGKAEVVVRRFIDECYKKDASIDTEHVVLLSEMRQKYIKWHTKTIGIAETEPYSINTFRKAVCDLLRDGGYTIRLPDGKNGFKIRRIGDDDDDDAGSLKDFIADDDEEENEEEDEEEDEVYSSRLSKKLRRRSRLIDDEAKEDE